MLAIATSFGITIFVLVYVAAPFSGGHINPAGNGLGARQLMQALLAADCDVTGRAVSLAFFLTKKLSVIRLLLYWAAQLGGAIVGACGGSLVC